MGWSARACARAAAKKPREQGHAGNEIAVKKKEEERKPANSITPETRKAIEAGLKFLGEGQHENGSFGKEATGATWASRVWRAWLFLAAGHRPG